MRATALPLLSLASALLCLAGCLASCAKPQPPQITPQRVSVMHVSSVGVSLEVELDALNPNKVDLAAQSIAAKVSLDGQTPVGSVTSSKAMALPAGQHTKLDVPLAVTWTDVPMVLAAAATADTLTYDVDGTVAVGGSSVNVDVPFHVEGTLTHAQVMSIVGKSVPQLPRMMHP